MLVAAHQTRSQDSHDDAMIMRSLDLLHLSCAVPPKCMPVTLEHTRVVLGVSQTGGLQADRLRHLAKYFATMLELEAAAGHRQAAAAKIGCRSVLTIATLSY